MRIRRLLTKDEVAVERYVPPPRRVGHSTRPTNAAPFGANPLTETGEVAESPDGIADEQPRNETPREADAISDAREQGAQEGYQRGYDEGVQAGQQQGYEAGAQETEAQLTAALETHFNSLLEALRSGAENVANEAAKLNDRFESMFPHAVLLVAETVVRHEVSANENALKALVHETMAQLDRTANVTVRLNPTDYERLSEQPSEVWNSERLSFAPDDSVAAGGAVFETNTAIVDARLETRLIEAARALLFPDANGT